MVSPDNYEVNRANSDSRRRYIFKAYTIDSNGQEVSIGRFCGFGNDVEEAAEVVSYKALTIAVRNNLVRDSNGDGIYLRAN